jgi:hypothetical protein
MWFIVDRSLSQRRLKNLVELEGVVISRGPNDPEGVVALRAATARCGLLLTTSIHGFIVTPDGTSWFQVNPTFLATVSRISSVGGAPRTWDTSACQQYAWRTLARSVMT